MPKPILPYPLRQKILDLFKGGLSSVEIFDNIIEESKPYVKSHEQLMRCLSSLKGNTTLKRKGKTEKKTKNFRVPKPKKFDLSKHQKITESLKPDMLGKDFENRCEPIAIDILKQNENFTNIENANQIPKFHNPPFDFFAFKRKMPFIVEVKSSLNSFNAPGETQKRRLQELLKQIKELNIALLQVKLNSGEYRIFYNDDMNLFFDGKKVSITPIVRWIDTKLEQLKADS